MRLCALCLLLCLAQAGARDLTETEALRLLAQSPYYREAAARVEITRARMAERSVKPNPSAAYTFEGAQRNDFFLVEQPLPLNGRLKLLHQAGESAVAASQAEAVQARVAAQAELRRAFYLLLQAQERQRTVQEHIAELERLVAILRERERAGEGSKFDRLRAEREIAEREPELADAGVRVSQHTAELSALLGDAWADLHATGDMQPAEATPSLDELLGKAVETRSELRALERQLDRSGLEERAAGRRKIPNPTVTAGLQRAEVITGIQYGAVAAVQVPLPLFNKGKAEAAAAQAEAARIRARLEILRARVASQVRATHSALLARRQALADYRRDARRKTQELKEIAEIAYREAELGILELLDSYRVAHESELRMLELAAVAKLAEIDLDRVVGEELIP